MFVVCIVACFAAAGAAVRDMLHRVWQEGLSFEEEGLVIGLGPFVCCQQRLIFSFVSPGSRIGASQCKGYFLKSIGSQIHEK